MTKSNWIFVFALFTAATAVSACASGPPTSAILGHLPAQQQNAIEQAMQNDTYIHLPAWLPFTPTHGTISKVVTLGKTPQTTYTVQLFDNSELLTIKEPFKGLSVYNIPQGLHLSNGVPATFQASKDQSMLCWSNGPNESFTLYSEKISGGSVQSAAGPDLTEDQLVKIAESTPTR